MPAASPRRIISIASRSPTGLPVQLVSGYKGTAEIRLAASSGEVAGACWSWESMRSTWRGALDSGEVVAVPQTSARAFPDLATVPLASSLAKTDEARQLIKVGIQNAAAFARPLALPPGTPKDRVLLLRKAFQETLKDAAFLAEAEKAKLTLDPGRRVARSDTKPTDGRRSPTALALAPAIPESAFEIFQSVGRRHFMASLLLCSLAQ